MPGLKNLISSLYLAGAAREKALREVTMNLTPATLILLLILWVGTAMGADASICNPGTDIVLYPNGQLKSCILRDFFTINGVVCNHFAIAEFYQTGQLRSCVNRDFFNYDGFVCNELGTISFYQSGKLDTCILAGRVEVEGKICVDLQSISLFENGKLKSCSTPR